MSSHEELNIIISRIEEANPLHAKKLRKYLKGQDEAFFDRATVFLARYKNYLKIKNKDLSYAVNCYLRMVSDMTLEAARFLETGHYSCKSFDEVKKNVYDQPEIMEYHMNGLLLSQFLWRHHYEIFSFFTQHLRGTAGAVQNYLEIGAGHGLYVSEALRVFPCARIKAVDISETALAMARHFVDDERVDFVLNNIFDFKEAGAYDFITLGEVLEHVEVPEELLKKIHCLLKDKGIAFLTVPSNSPAVDHIYLFHSAENIKNMIISSGFDIIRDIHMYTEDVDEKLADKLKVSSMYGAFVRKRS